METDELKSELRKLSKRIIELNNSDDSSVQLRDKLRNIKDLDPDLKEYLYLRSGKDETDFNKLKADYLQILHQTLHMIESVNYKADQGYKLALELEPLKKELKKNKINQTIMFITAFICIFWGLYTVNPTAGDRVVDMFKHLIKLFSFGVI